MPDASSVSRDLASLGASGWQVFGLSPARPFRVGTRTVIGGDSMSSQFNDVQSPSASYNPATRSLQLTLTSGAVPVGMAFNLWNRNYGSLLRKRRVTGASRIDANNWTVLLDDAPADLPNGALATPTYVQYLHRTSNYGWIAWLQMLMNWPFNIVNNGAQDGDTSNDVLVRLRKDVLAYDPDLVIMQAPMINDQATPGSPRDEESTWADMAAIISLIVNNGTRLILATTTPVASGEARATRAIMSRVQRLNQRLQAYVQGSPSVLLLDPYSLVVDPANTTGLALAARLKADFIHYSGAGGLLFAKYAQPRVAAWLPGDFETKPKSALDCFSASAATGTTASISRVNGVLQVPTTAAHGFVVGETIGVTGCNVASANGWWTVVGVPSTTQVNLQTGGADFVAGTVSTTTTLSRNRNLWPNPLLNNAATGGTVSAPWNTTTSPVMPQNLNTTVQAGTVVQDNTQVQATVVAAASGFGNAARLVVNCCSAGALFGFQTASITALLVNQMAAGRRYRGQFRMDLSSTSWANTPISEIYAVVTIQMDSTYTFNVQHANTESVVQVQENLGLNGRIPEFDIPAGTVTQAYLTVCIRAATAWNGGVTPPASNGNACTFDLSQIAFEQVSP